jgi:superfamily I DNA/RNA helicase
MKWMIEEAKLGKNQRDIIEEIGKTSGRPVWIQGHAGSGKSVVLLHALSDYLIRNKEANVVVVVFTKALVDLIKLGIKQIPALKKRHVPVFTIYQLDKKIESGDRYDAIFCDEVQDLPMVFIEKMKNSCTQLVIAGDASQSIYGHLKKWKSKPALSEEIMLGISPIQKKSSTIYRLTKSVIAVLKNVFSDLVNDKTYSGKEDSQIRLFQSNTDNAIEETTFSWDELEMINRIRPEEVAAILIFEKKHIIFYCQQVLKHKNKEYWNEKKVTQWEKEKYDFDDLNKHLTKNGIPLMFVGNGKGSLEEVDEKNKIIIMTYHSAKGLDFDTVCLPYLSVDLDKTDNEDALILVALSRAKRDLIITYTQYMYNGFKKFLKDLTPKIINDESDEEILF